MVRQTIARVGVLNPEALSLLCTVKMFQCSKRKELLEKGKKGTPTERGKQDKRRSRTILKKSLTWTCCSPMRKALAAGLSASFLVIISRSPRFQSAAQPHFELKTLLAKRERRNPCELNMGVANSNSRERVKINIQGESNMHQIVVTVLCRLRPPILPEGRPPTSRRGMCRFPVPETPLFLWKVLLFLETPLGGFWGEATTRV